MSSNGHKLPVLQSPRKGDDNSKAFSNDGLIKLDALTQPFTPPSPETDENEMYDSIDYDPGNYFGAGHEFGYDDTWMHNGHFQPDHDSINHHPAYGNMYQQAGNSNAFGGIGGESSAAHSQDGGVDPNSIDWTHPAMVENMKLGAGTPGYEDPWMHDYLGGNPANAHSQPFQGNQHPDETEWSDPTKISKIMNLGRHN